MKPDVYIDVLVTENYFINLMLLYGVKRYYRIKTRIINMIIGPIIGALYVIVAFYPDLHMFYTLLMKILVSVLMIILSFYPDSFKKFIKYLLIFYIEAFMLGGSILATFFITNNNIKIYNGIVFFKNINIGYIIIGTIIMILFIKIIFDCFDKYYYLKNNCIGIDIYFNNKSCYIDGFIDTGNSLKDPITNEPIIIVSTKAVISILPIELLSMLYTKKAPIEIFSYMSNSKNVKNLKLIPFHTIGTKDGMLIGLRVDKVNFYMNNKKSSIIKPIIGLYNNSFEKNERYQAILNPEIIKN